MDSRVAFLEKQKYRLKKLIWENDHGQQSGEEKTPKEMFLCLANQYDEIERQAQEKY